MQDPQKEILHDKTSHVYFYKLYSDTFSVIHSHGLAYMVKRIKEDNLIRENYAQRNYRLALLLLGLTDYYHRTQDEAPDPAYHDLRGMILDHPVYSLHTIAYNDDHDTFERVTKHARRCAIPELARHNIYITEVEFLRMA